MATFGQSIENDSVIEKREDAARKLMNTITAFSGTKSWSSFKMKKDKSEQPPKQIAHHMQNSTAVHESQEDHDHTVRQFIRELLKAKPKERNMHHCIYAYEHYFHRSEFFSRFDSHTAAKIICACELRRSTPSTPYVEKGEEANGMFIMFTGKAYVMVPGIPVGVSFSISQYSYIHRSYVHVFGLWYFLG